MSKRMALRRLTGFARPTSDPTTAAGKPTTIGYSSSSSIVIFTTKLQVTLVDSSEPPSYTPLVSTTAADSSAY